MNGMEFAALLSQLNERPVPPIAGRHVYLWHGEPAELWEMMPTGLGSELDLYEIAAAMEKTPLALDEARRLLHGRIAEWLRQHPSTPDRRQVIVVTGNTLLPRYRVPLDSFFQASTETRLIVFVVSPLETGYRPPPRFPANVELHPGSTLAYLKSQLGDQTLVEERSS